VDTSREKKPFWITGRKPWARRELAHGRRVRCMFCGGDEVILSYDDEGLDYGRIELYCDSPDCDVRRMVVLIVQGEEANLRADVRALDAVDKFAPPIEPDERSDDEYDSAHESRSYESEPLSGTDLTYREAEHNKTALRNDSDAPTRRRISGAPFRMNVE